MAMYFMRSFIQKLKLEDLILLGFLAFIIATIAVTKGC